MSLHSPTYTLTVKAQSKNKQSITVLETLINNRVKSYKVKKVLSINMPLYIKKYNVLRSPHVNKKSHDTYEIRFFSRLFVFKNISASDLSDFRTFFCADKISDLILKVQISSYTN